MNIKSTYEKLTDLLVVDVMIFHETIGLQMLPAHFLTVWQCFYHNPQSLATLLPSKWSPDICIPPSNIISLLSVITPEHSISNVNEHTPERAHKCHISHQKIKRKSYTKSVFSLLQVDIMLCHLTTLYYL